MFTIQTQACAWQNLAIPTLTYQYHATQATNQQLNSYKSRLLVLWLKCFQTQLKAKTESGKPISIMHALRIQEYVLIATKYQAVEIQRRSGDEWTLHLFGPSDEIELASLGIRFPLSILYRGTVVPEMLNGQGEPD